ncbi:MAG: hypothetical protein TECD_00810 [Hyphomicrobiaceae bacterium hypho_1]
MACNSFSIFTFILVFTLATCSSLCNSQVKIKSLDCIKIHYLKNLPSEQFNCIAAEDSAHIKLFRTLLLNTNIYPTNEIGFSLIPLFIAPVQFEKNFVAKDIQNNITANLWHTTSGESTPLAGSELEQKRINSNLNHSLNNRELFSILGSKKKRGLHKSTLLKSKENTVNENNIYIKNQNADNTEITLFSLKDGIKHSERVNILRPPISSAALKFLSKNLTLRTKREPRRDVWIELSNGTMMIATVNLTGELPRVAEGDEFLIYRSPLFKVWAKGERLEPRPGRADHQYWPRPKPRPIKRRNSRSNEE